MKRNIHPKTVRRALAAVTLCVSLPLAVGAADAADTDYAAVLAGHYPADEPGATAIVVRGDETLFRGASGMADMEFGIALEPDMVFRLGSITKQFTGVAIRLLELEGQLTLDDPLTQFLPDYPMPEGKTVTVAHLLAHTSGIKSYTGIPGYMDQEIRRDLTMEQLIDVFDDEPFDFEPGERYLYNNSGYVLLGAIIEKASGMSYEQFIEERLFGPLGMERSDYGDPERIIPRRARGYQPSGDAWQNAPFLSMTQPHAAGSLLSNVDDMATWYRGLWGGKLMKSEDTQKLWQTFATNDGEDVGYGYGFAIDTLRGESIIQHGGGIHGFRTYALAIPEKDVYVAVLTNGARQNPGRVARELAAIAIDKAYEQRTAVELPAETLQRYVGIYQINEDETRTVRYADGQLTTQRTGGGRSRIMPESETRFFYPDTFTYLDFELDADGRVTGMMLYPEGEEPGEQAVLTDEKIATRERFELTPQAAAEVAGRYEVAPRFVITVRAEGVQLYTQATGQAEVPLYASGPDAYFLEVADAELMIERDDSGTIVRAILKQGGREMPARRLEE